MNGCLRDESEPPWVRAGGAPRAEVDGAAAGGEVCPGEAGQAGAELEDGGGAVEVGERVEEDAAEEGGLGARGGGLGVEVELAGGEAAGVDGVGGGALVGGVGGEVRGGLGAILALKTVEILEDCGLNGVKVLLAELGSLCFEVANQLRAQIQHHDEVKQLPLLADFGDAAASINWGELHRKRDCVPVFSFLDI